VKYHELRPNKEARPQRRRLGRGMGSGRGKTAGRGTKGQLARSGGGKPAPFIGGAFPLTRTMPHKKGFRSPFRVEFALVKVGALNERFEDGATVTLETLQAAGLVKEREKKPVKLLSDGEITKRLTVRVDRASTQARSKIEAAGGTVEETLPRKKAGAPASGEEA
jgi:large subunit ribosomal protein L15